MNEEKLEQLLKGIYSRDIAPSEKLIRQTKDRLLKNRFAARIVALVVSFNLAVFLAFISFIISVPYSIMYKVILYMTVTCVYNLLALAAYLYKDNLSEFFQK